MNALTIIQRKSSYDTRIGANVHLLLNLQEAHQLIVRVPGNQMIHSRQNRKWKKLIMLHLKRTPRFTFSATWIPEKHYFGKSKPWLMHVEQFQEESLTSLFVAAAEAWVSCWYTM